MAVPSATLQRYSLESIAPAEPAASFAEEVRSGLTATPKFLECRFFYDEAGSQLFEEICGLPEYYLTRAEREILASHADEIAQRAPAATLVELGSGSATKTRLLIDALLRLFGEPGEQHATTLCYVPIDISREMLEDSSRALLAAYPRLAIHAVAAEYRDGLRRLRDAGFEGPKLVVWLGSNVGNFERAEAADFLRDVRSALHAEDRLLAGIDLRKSRAVLEPAYDDAQGVTARFNKNLLKRINDELGGHFDLKGFGHRAEYDEVEGRIEMYLVSRDAQTVSIDALDLRIAFAPGEAIHTENSYKYSAAEVDTLAAEAGFTVQTSWQDAAGRFGDYLLRPAEST
ncbi:MAG: L-histidine N(alpha)-methyltransferase [Chloroflexota bacterium]